MLGNEVYENLAEGGRRTTPAAMAVYALEQIEVARAELASPTELE